MWKLPQMPSCSANNANSDKNNFDMFYKIDCCAAIQFLISFLILRNLVSNPGFLFLYFFLLTLYFPVAVIHIINFRLIVRGGGGGGGEIESLIRLVWTQWNLIGKIWLKILLPILSTTIFPKLPFPLSWTKPSS